MGQKDLAVTPEAGHEVASTQPTESEVSEMSPLLRLAVEKSLSIEAIKELVQLHREEQDRQAARAFAQAMASFHEKCPPIPRKTENAQFTVTRAGTKRPSRYAALEDIDATIREPLAAEGLSRRWGSATIQDGMLTMDCIITHIGGHSESSSATMPVESKAGSSPQQKYGTAMAYVQRYSLIAALGLTTCHEDADGNQSESGAAIGEEQVRTLQSLIEEVGSDESRICKVYGVARLEELPIVNYSAAVAMLEQKRRVS